MTTRPYDELDENSSPQLTTQKANLPTIAEIQSKIFEFSKTFSSEYRLSLLNCTASEKENLVFSLLILKKSIKTALEELGNSLTSRQYHFKCGVCDRDITVNANENIWSKLQSHEHFEEQYVQFLNGTLVSKPIKGNPLSDYNFITGDSRMIDKSNTKHSIEHQPMDHSTSTKIPTQTESSTDENVNSFRFNFKIPYDEEIENKLYPQSIMQSLCVYDRIREYSIMRVGVMNAVCLICPCAINGTKINKTLLVNHAVGQRHLKAISDKHKLELLQFYHEFWSKQCTPIQAHQVYFHLSRINEMKCVLCSVKVNSDMIFEHIKEDPHKQKVLEIYEKRVDKMYFLVDLQVQLYDITLKKEEEGENCEVKRTKNKSESLITDETKKRTPSDEESHGITHNIIKSVDNLTSTNPLDILPNRMKSNLNFFKLISKPQAPIVIQCGLCKVNLANNIETLKMHIITSLPHVSLTKEKYTFYCEICNIRITNEKDWLAHNFEGPRHVNMAASRRQIVTEYECTICRTIIFGDEVSLARHLAIGNKRRERKDKGSRFPDHIKKLLKSKEHILEQAEVLVRDAEFVLENSLTQDCCRRLEMALLEFFDNCKVYPFGSRVSGLGNKDSDLDVFVDIGGTYYGEKNQHPADQVLMIRKSMKAFMRSKEYTNLVEVISARTPILKLHHLPTNLDCDLSFKHGLSVENTKFLRFCLELQPISQQLILLVKKWAEYVTFENITTYAWAIMCIFYLQVKGHLLSVEKIREMNKEESRPISGWKTIAYVLSVSECKTSVKPYEQTVYELLSGFFTYYMRFDFNSYVLCPLLGRVVQRSLFSEASAQQLPSEMTSYVAQLEGESPEIFRFNSYMCIQDPFDLSHNLTKAVQQGTLTRFQNMCKMTLAHMM